MKRIYKREVAEEIYDGKIYDSKQFPIRKKPKRTKNGSLYYNGKLVYENLPFPLLQHKKQALLQQGGYVKNKFETHYYYEK